MNPRSVSPPSRRVLVVENDSVPVRYLRKYLQGEGYIVEHATHAQSALAKLRARAYDAYIVDVNIPGSVGCNALDLLDDLGPDAVPPERVIFITGFPFLGKEARRRFPKSKVFLKDEHVPWQDVVRAVDECCRS